MLQVGGKYSGISFLDIFGKNYTKLQWKIMAYLPYKIKSLVFSLDNHIKNEK